MKLLGMLQIMTDVFLLLPSKAGLLPATPEDGGGSAALLLQSARTERGEGSSSTSAIGGSTSPASRISVMLQRVAGSGGLRAGL